MKKILSFVFLMISPWLSFETTAQTTSINGLTVMVNYTDYTFSESVSDVSDMMNQATGYTNWGNTGSVKQYYSVQSNGLVTINSQVIAVSVPNTFGYYHNNKNQLLIDLTSAINTAYPSGFSNLTVHPTQSKLWYLLILSKGYEGDGVTFPFDLGLSITNNGSALPLRSAAFAGWTSTQHPDINVICHESGHGIFGWTDFYITDRARYSNLGHYCLMGSGGKQGCPMPINPALRYQQQWIGSVTELNNNTTQTYSVTSNNYNQVYKYTNAFNPKEYYLIVAYQHGGYYVSLDGDGYIPQEGLAIWYVDEDGGLDKPNAGATDQLRIKLVQADGIDEMNDRTKPHHDLRGDDSDLFNDTYNSFTDAAYPMFRWKDSSETGLIITNVSAAGATMTFKVNARPGTLSVSPSLNGKTVPSGLVTVASGAGQTLNFVPDIGYAVDQVTVNGVAQGAISSYTFSSVSGTQNVAVTFKTASSGYTLPSPWQSNDIGNPSTAGVTGYSNGTFGITTYGSDIYWNSDQFTYVYQSVSGNAEIIARVAGFNLPNEWSKAGIMIRESLSANAKEVMLVHTPWNGIANQYRTATGGDSYNYNEDTLKSVTWLKLNRNGSTITSSYSRDGINWTSFNSVSVSMSNTVYVGLCAAGPNNTIANKSTYDQVSVNGVAATFAPTTALTSPSNGATFTAPASITINATATDSDGSISKVEFYNGSTLLGTDYSSPYAYTWSSVSAGTYSLTVKAYDNLNVSTVSSAVSITVNGTGGSCTAAVWNASTAYVGGNVVQYNGIKYIANWWTMNENPETHNGGAGSGQPWTSQGTCTSRMGNDAESVAQFIKVAPNPATEQATVLLTLPQDEENASLRVLDQTGTEVLFLYQGNVKAGEQNINLQAYTLTKGFYILAYQSDSRRLSVPFIKH